MKLIVRTRNTSCRGLKELDTGNKRVIYRMGSTTPTLAITRRPVDLEINSVEGCSISSDKRLMKHAFVDYSISQGVSIPTAEFINSSNLEELLTFYNTHCTEYGVIIKKYNSSKGNNIFKIDTEEEFQTWIASNRMNLLNYVFEKYYIYSKEYRLHVTNDGCFYACRKMLRDDADVRWHRHENNSVWILEENPLFAKPSNWQEIVQACINAKNAVKLDIAAIDVKCTTWMSDPAKFIILETNSAPALGAIGLEKYKELLTNIIQ